MEANFVLYNLAWVDGDQKVSMQGSILVFDSLAECFDYLDKKGQPISSNSFCQARQDLYLASANKDRQDIIVYEPYGRGPHNADGFGVQLARGVSCAYIHQQSGASLQYEEFLKARDAWARRAFARKVFHPGNFLTLAFILTAVGLGLIAFGVACPPTLVFVALGIAAFSAISAISSAIDWVSRDWSFYKAETDVAGEETSLGSYLENCWERLKKWIPKHKFQAVLMGIGALIFFGALAVTAGHFIAIAVTGAGFAFMTMGPSGGALGLIGGFFTTGFVAELSGLTSSSVAALTSAFAAIVLVLGPTNIFDSVRRFFGWAAKEGDPNEPPVTQFLSKKIVDKANNGGIDINVTEYKLWKNAETSSTKTKVIEIDLGNYNGTYNFDS